MTPEVFVLDKYNNNIYSGKIDTLYEDIGKRESVVTEHYIQKAIDAMLQQESLGVFPPL